MAERKATRKRRTKKTEPEDAAGGNGVGVEPEVAKKEGETVFAEDHVMKLTEAELNKFNLLRLKVESTLQSVRVLELEQDRETRAYVDQKHQREQLIKQKRAQVDPLNNEYLDYVRDLAAKYKLHPQKMGIDDETGVLRDLRPQEEAEPG
jgi:hypothetical protein